jgi:hypothetical protein
MSFNLFPGYLILRVPLYDHAVSTGTPVEPQTFFVTVTLSALTANPVVELFY